MAIDRDNALQESDVNTLRHGIAEDTSVEPPAGSARLQGAIG